jgi:hypothetical protein
VAIGPAAQTSAGSPWRRRWVPSRRHRAARAPGRRARCPPGPPAAAADLWWRGWRKALPPERVAGWLGTWRQPGRRGGYRTGAGPDDGPGPRWPGVGRPGLRLRGRGRGWVGRVVARAPEPLLRQSNHWRGSGTRGPLKIRSWRGSRGPPTRPVPGPGPQTGRVRPFVGISNTRSNRTAGAWRTPGRVRHFVGISNTRSNTNRRSGWRADAFDLSSE